MTDRYSKLTRGVPIPKNNASQDAVAVLEIWIILDGILDTIMMEHGLPFVPKLFAALCARIETKLITTMEYHPQAIHQVERCYTTLVARLRHYINKRQTNWETYKQPLSYGYSTQEHRAASSTLFSSALNRERHRALVREKTRASEQYGMMSSYFIKPKTLTNLRFLKRQAKEASQ